MHKGRNAYLCGEIFCTEMNTTCDIIEVAKTTTNSTSQILCGNCVEILQQIPANCTDLTFLDPPFNQQKDYAMHNDNMPPEQYWAMMNYVCKEIYDITCNGGCIYFMQREKNAEPMLHALSSAGWTFQNLIIWKKKTSAVPVQGKYGKQYQIIAYATKGMRAKTFNRLRIDPPMPAGYKQPRENGIFVTDVWDDIRELTSGYFAGEEAIRNHDGARFHKQQTPIALLLRILLTSTAHGGMVLDPFAGTGTTAAVAQQLGRRSISVEIDPQNVECIKNRIDSPRAADSIQKYYHDYACTDGLSALWGMDSNDSNMCGNKK